MPQYWFVLTFVDSLEGEIFQTPLESIRWRDMEVGCQEAAQVLLDEFLEGYLQGQDVETMDWETWRMYVFDHRPDEEEFLDAAGYACASAEWWTPGMDEDPDVR